MKNLTDAELILMIQSGDSEAENEFCKRHIKLAYEVANRFKESKGAWRGDIESSALFGLLRAVRRFNVEKKYKFSTFAVPVIANEIKKEFQSQGTAKRSLFHSVSLFQKVEGVDEEFQHTIPSNHCVEDHQIAKDMLVAMFDKLDDKQKQIFYLFCHEGYNHEEVSEVVGVSVRRLREHLWESRRMLRKLRDNGVL